MLHPRTRSSPATKKVGILAIRIRNRRVRFQDEHRPRSTPCRQMLALDRFNEAPYMHHLQ
jgi:hypothetical protein